MCSIQTFPGISLEEPNASLHEMVIHVPAMLQLSRVHVHHVSPLHLSCHAGTPMELYWLFWWCRQDLGPDKRPSLAVKYSHWEVTYAALCDALRQHKPDGLFGFSQGATATALFLASLITAQRQGRDLDVPLPKFCVVVGQCAVRQAGITTAVTSNPCIPARLHLSCDPVSTHLHASTHAYVGPKEIIFNNACSQTANTAPNSAFTKTFTEVCYDMTPAYVTYPQEGSSGNKKGDPRP